MKDIVKIALIKKNITQKELANDMQISTGYLQDLLSGRRNSKLRLTQMAELLDIDLSEYINTKNEENSK
jgi:Helix-turn-helix.